MVGKYPLWEVMHNLMVLLGLCMSRIIIMFPIKKQIVGHRKVKILIFGETAVAFGVLMVST